jgi:hypothetical protein
MSVPTYVIATLTKTLVHVRLKREMFEVVSHYLLEIKTRHCAAYVTCGRGSYNGTSVALKALSRQHSEEYVVWCSCTFAARGKSQAHFSSNSVKGMF